MLNFKYSKNLSKYRNTKILYKGVKFDSKLEFYMKSLLEGYGIEHEFQKTIRLLDGIERNNTYKELWKKMDLSENIFPLKNQRAIKLVIDFQILIKECDHINLFVDTKGVETQLFKIKEKLLHDKFDKIGETCLILKPHTKDECNAVAYRIKEYIELIKNPF